MQRNRIALGLAAGILNEAANKLIPLATLHFAATRLGVKPFGYSQFSQWLTDLAIMMVGLGFSHWAPIAWRDADEKSRPQIFGTIVVTRVVLAALACSLLYAAVQSDLGWSEYRWIVLPSLFVVITSAFDSYWAVISLRALPLFSGISIAAKLLSLVAILILVKGPDNALEYTLSLQAANAIISMASFFYVLKVIGWSWPTGPRILKACKDSFPYMISVFLIIALERVDMAMVEAALGAEGAGAYGGPMKIAVSLTPIAGMVVMVFFSEMLSIFDDESMLRHLRAGLRVAMLILAPLVAGIWFVDHEVTLFILGPEFSKFTRVLPILCTGIMAQMFILVFGNQVLALRGKVNLFNWSLAVGVLSIVGLSVLLSPKFGLEGFAAASAGGRWIAATIAAFFSFMIMSGGRRRVVFEVAKSMVPVGLMTAALLLMPNFTWYLTILAGGVVYCTAAALLFHVSISNFLKSRKSLANQ